MKKILKSIREFGLFTTVICSLSRIMRLLKFPGSSINKYVNYKNFYLSEWLWRRFKSTVIVKRQVELKKSNYMFVFWWQGIAEAPEIVKACIKSIQYWCLDNTIIILDEDNYSNYVSMPSCVINAFSKGEVSIAHFSDVMRFELLRKYGGIWIDATCFITHPIPQYVYDYSFFSLNGAYTNDLNWKWTSWFMSVKKGDLLVENMWGTCINPC